MLVLSRRVGESTEIGDEIIVKILEIRKDGSVRIGIEAPSDVFIRRDDYRKEQTSV